MNLVESYIELGVKSVDPFSPPPLGDTDLAAAKRLVNGRYVMVGGVDQVNVLQGGAPDLVAEVTKRTVETGKPGGGFMLSSADFLEYGTPLVNVETFVRTGIEYGRY
jgi:uroporphyrinogen-III decarboxylase